MLQHIIKYQERKKSWYYSGWLVGWMIWQNGWLVSANSLWLFCWWVIVWLLVLADWLYICFRVVAVVVAVGGNNVCLYVAKDQQTFLFVYLFYIFIDFIFFLFLVLWVQLQSLLTYSLCAMVIWTIVFMSVLLLLNIYCRSFHE